jgi:hypothetical protein
MLRSLRTAWPVSLSVPVIAMLLVVMSCPLHIKPAAWFSQSQIWREVDVQMMRKLKRKKGRTSDSAAFVAMSTANCS